VPAETPLDKKIVPNTLSVCIIVKNEADLLARCLNSIKSAADELVVVDTGSTDNTVEIAKSLGAKVICTQWRDDFAWARNISIKHATGSWILWLDADDVVPPESLPVFTKLKCELPDCIFGFTVRNQRPGNTGTEFVQARMFPNRPDIYFERPIHEQIMPSALRIGMVMKTRDAVIEHHGYADPATMKKKALRNVKLLIADYNDQDPDTVTTVEIADSYQLIEDHENAIKWYKKTLSIPDCEKTTPSIAGHAHLGLGNIYNLQKDYALAVSHLKKASEISPWRPDIFYSLAVGFEQNGQPENAVDCLYKIFSMEEKAGQVGVDFRAAKIKAHLRLLRLLTELNKIEEARKLVADILASDSKRPELLNAAGKFFIKENRLIDGLRTFEKSILLIKDGNLEAYIGLCIIYIKADMKPKALETIESLKVDFSDNPRFNAFRSLITDKAISEEDASTISLLRREFYNCF
jgi:glycosyltransferase involved in cell wall biosynthesis